MASSYKRLLMLEHTENTCPGYQNTESRTVVHGGNGRIFSYYEIRARFHDIHQVTTCIVRDCPYMLQYSYCPSVCPSVRAPN